jgi:integrase
MLALVLLAVDTGLRLAEALRLDLADVMENENVRAPKIRPSFYLTKQKAKGRANDKRAGYRGYTSARLIHFPKRVRVALRRYVLELAAREWITTASGPLWLTVRGGRNRSSGPWRTRISKRAVQADWQKWQRKAGIRDPYRWHDLRHTATTRWGEATSDPFAVAKLAGHNDLRTALRYVHKSPERLAQIAETASRGG